MLLPSSDFQKELLKFFGIGRMTAPRVLARLSIPRLAKVEDLSEAHVAALTAYLSSTTISDLPPRTPVIDPLGERELLEGETAAELNDKQRGAADWGRQLLVENELRGKMNADIRTLIDIGTWRGRRCVCRLLQSLSARRILVLTLPRARVTLCRPQAPAAQADQGPLQAQCPDGTPAQQARPALFDVRQLGGLQASEALTDPFSSGRRRRPGLRAPRHLQAHPRHSPRSARSSRPASARSRWTILFARLGALLPGC